MYKLMRSLMRSWKTVIKGYSPLFCAANTGKNYIRNYWNRTKENMGRMLKDVSEKFKKFHSRLYTVRPKSNKTTAKKVYKAIGNCISSQ